jgi:hypothetical protein
MFILAGDTGRVGSGNREASGIRFSLRSQAERFA